LIEGASVMPEAYKPFDVALKELIASDPLAWLHFLGLPGTSAVLMSEDLSTQVTDVDRLLSVRNPDYIVHLELQSSYKKDLAPRTLMHNAIAHYRYGKPVNSVILLLRPEADGPAMRQPIVYGKMKFDFDVVRLWEKTAEELLSAPLALLPLAPLANVSDTEVVGVVKQMEARIDAEAAVEVRETLWDTTLVLMGLKYKPEFSLELLKGMVMELTDSSTYQFIHNEGKAEGKMEESRRLVLLLGGKRFGEPDAQTQAALDAITEPEVMEKLAIRLFEVESWTELIQ
jgi:predicted transposase YdaD